MSNYPRLDDNGLLYYTQQIKQKIDSAMPPDMTGATSSTNGVHGLVPQPNAGQEGQFLRGDGAWATPAGTANVIESISVNGTGITPDVNKNVNITVPTKTSDITNDSDFQTGTQVDTKIASAISTTYVPKGSCTFATLPSLVAGHRGWVYNVSDAFTTTADFVEGAGKSYPAGTNVVVVESTVGTSTVYMYDVLAGFIDTSGFVLATEMTTISNSTIDTIIATAFPTT